MLLQPGDVPCYVLLSGVQVPRVIGRAGSIIKELRQETGATVNVLDRPPAIPEALQKLDIKVAFIRGNTDAETHSAVIGLIRNARGPETIRQLDPDPHDNSVRLFVPEKAEAHLSVHELVDGTACSLAVSAMDGVRRHRVVAVAGSDTADLQVVSWRVHEEVLRLARSGLLGDRDFDLQDSAWEAAMHAFQSKRQQPPQNAAAPVAEVLSVSSAASQSRAPSLAEAAAFEAQLQRQREVRDREAQERDERERRARARELQARDARERHAAATEARTLEDQAREAWAKAAEAQNRGDAAAYDGFVAEAKRFEAQSQEARARSIHGADRQLAYATAGQTAASDEVPAATIAPSSTPAPASAPPPAAHIDAARAATEEAHRRAAERQRLESEARQRRLLEEERERVRFEHESLERRREAQLREDRDRHEREERERARELPPQPQRPPSPQQQQPPYQQQQQQELQRQPNVHLQASPQAQIAHATSAVPAAASFAVVSELHVALPSIDVARYLAGHELGIARRAGVALMAGHVSEEQPALQIKGAPVAVAVACLLLQEAMWMSRLAI